MRKIFAELFHDPPEPLEIFAAIGFVACVAFYAGLLVFMVVAKPEPRSPPPSSCEAWLTQCQLIREDP